MTEILEQVKKVLQSDMSDLGKVFAISDLTKPEIVNNTPIEGLQLCD